MRNGHLDIEYMEVHTDEAGVIGVSFNEAYGYSEGNITLEELIELDSLGMTDKQIEEREWRREQK